MSTSHTRDPLSDSGKHPIHAQVAPTEQRESKVAALALLLLYVAAILAPLWVALAVGRRGNGSLASFVHGLGVNVAFVGFSMLAMQFVLAARLRWSERPFGLDMVYQFHRAMGALAGLLLLAHPVLVAAAHGEWFLLFGLHVQWYIWVGRFVLIVLVVQAMTAIFRRALRLEYQKWQAVHGALALSLLLGGLVHSWYAGGEMRNAAMKALWLLLSGAALLAYLWRRRAPGRLRRHAYAVTEVRQEAQGVWTVSLAPQSGAPAPEYLPGQYQYLTLCRDGLSVEEHPFTLSSSPTQRDTLSSTIKAAGDFTETISRTRPGDTALVVAPFGRFSYVLHPHERELVFIAGGVGITPLMSMLRHMRDTRAQRSVLLLYANRTADDIVFREELAEMEGGDAPALTAIHVLSKPGADWTGETGHIEAALVERHCPAVAGKGFYVCGPTGLIDAATADLRGLGVPAKRIHFERFGY